jgi:hypothetical protein
MARPSHPPSPHKQHKRFASLATLNTNLSFRKPLPPRRSLPALGSKPLSPLPDPPEPSPLTAILEGIANAGSNSDRHPSLLADGDVGVLDSADSPIPLTAFESQAAAFFTEKQTAMEKFWDDLPSQPEEKRKEAMREALTSQMKNMDECFRHFLQAVKRVRELEEAQALKTCADESERAKELEKLKIQNKDLVAAEAQLGLELRDMRDKNRQLQADFKAREAALADSPAYDGPLDTGLVKLWLEGEATYYMTQHQQGAVADDRPLAHDSASNGGGNASTPITPTVTKRRRAKRSLFGAGVNADTFEIMEEFVSSRLADSTTATPQTVEEMKQHIRKIQSDLDDERFQHRLIVEDWERIRDEPISLEFYKKAAAKEPLPFLTNTIKQLHDELDVAEESLAEEKRKAKHLTSDLQDRYHRLEKDLVTQRELVLRLQTDLDTWKHEFTSVEKTRNERYELKERNKEQAGYIQLRSDAWRHAEVNQQTWKKRLAELERDANDLKSRNDQFIERIMELEDREKLLEAQLREQTDWANKLAAYKTEAEAKTNQFIERIEELEDQETSLEIRLGEQRDRANKLEAEKAEIEAMLAPITTQLEQLKPMLEDQDILQAQLAEARMQLANTELDLETKRLRLSESRQRMQELEQTKTGLERQLAQFKDLQDRERSLRRELADKDDELLTEQLRNVDLSAQMRKLAAKLETVEADLQVEQNKCADFIQRIEELEDEVKEQKTHISEVNVASSDAETMESRHLATIAGLEATIAGLQAQIEHHSNTISLLMAKPPLSSKRVELLKRQTQTPRDLRMMISRLTTQKNKYHDRWLRAKQALDTAREDLACLVAQKDADTERERVLREQIASLEKEYATIYASLVCAMAELGVVMEIDVPVVEDTRDVVDDLSPSPPRSPTTYSPDPITKITDVIHRHSEACFCSLVDYFLPGVLDHILPEPPTTNCSCCCDDDTHSHSDIDDDSDHKTPHGLSSTEPAQIDTGSEIENSSGTPISRHSHSSEPPPSLDPTQIDPGLEEEEEDSLYDVPLRKVVTDPGPGFGYNHAYDYGLRVEDDEVRFEPYGVYNDEETGAPVIPETDLEQRYLTRSECREYGIEIERTKDEASQAGEEGDQSEGDYEEEEQLALEEAEDQPSDEQCDVEFTDKQHGLSLRGGGSSDAGSSDSDIGAAELFEEAADEEDEPAETDITRTGIPELAAQTDSWDAVGVTDPASTTDSQLFVTPSRTPDMPLTFSGFMTGTTVFGTGDSDTAKPASTDIAEAEQEHVAPSELGDPFQHAEGSQIGEHVDGISIEHSHGDSYGKPNLHSGREPKVHFAHLSTGTTIKSYTKYPRSPAVSKQANKKCICNCHTVLSNRHYHGHTSPFYSPAGLFTKQTATTLICNLLTALLWLAFLILQTPGTFLSTLSIVAGYLFLPLGYIFAMGVHSIRQLTYRTTPLFPTFQTTCAPPPISRPSMPVMPRPSAHQIVTSALFLMAAYLIIASEGLAAERETWTTANRFRTAYAADLVDHLPYPGWSPINVDFRFVVREWCNAFMFFRGGMGTFVQGINSMPAVVMHACDRVTQTFIQGIMITANAVVSAGAQILHIWRTNIDVLGESLERSLDLTLHNLWSPIPITGFWLATSLSWAIHIIRSPFAILNSMLQTLLVHLYQLANQHLHPECLGGLSYMGECAIDFARDKFDALGEWLERPLEVLDERRVR